MRLLVLYADDGCSKLIKELIPTNGYFTYVIQGFDGGFMFFLGFLYFS